MKRIVSPVAFATILIPMILSANSTTVTFDTALTNTTGATGWTFNDKIKFGKEKGRYYASAQGARIESAQFDFNITSVSIRVSTTSACTRNLVLTPSQSEAGAPAQSYEFTDLPQDAETDLSATWDALSQIRAFTISSTTGAKNLYFHSATISGVPIVEPPTGLRASDIKATRCRLSWTNSTGASSNRVDVSSIARRKASGETIEEYDFLAFTNTNVNAQSRLDEDNLLMDYPAFSGEKLYMAGLSTGVVQISSREDRGCLVYDRSRLAADNLTLVVSAKKHSSDTSGTWGLSVAQLDDGGTTNSLAVLDLDCEFPSSPFAVPLPDCKTPGPLLLFPSDSAKGNRRILIDDIAFVHDYSPEVVETNVVKTVFTTCEATTVRGLKPNSEYIAQVLAFCDGYMSPPSASLDFETNGSEIPFIIGLR